MARTLFSNPIEKLPTKRLLLRPRTIAIIVFVLVLIGIGVTFFMHSHSSADWQKNTAKVQKGSVDIEIIATGTIRPVNEIKVSPKFVGLIKKLFVKQGDVVKEGQVLARMDDSNLVGQIEAARGSYLMTQDTYNKILHGNRPQEVLISKFQERRANDIVRQAEHNVTRLRAQLESMQQQTIRDDTIAQRQTYLESEGAASDQDRLNAETQAKMTSSSFEAAKRELAQAQAALAQNKSELAAAQEQYELSRIGNREEDVLSAKHAVEQSKGNLDNLLSQLEDMTIKAPFGGVVTQKYADAGAIVTPTTSASAPSTTSSATSSSIVALAGNLEMVAQVAETDIGKVEIGQAVDIISNAYPEKTFHGTVTQIAPEAVVNQNVTTFEVHSTINDDNKGRLLSGMNVSAHFSCGTLDDALLVPTVCIVSRHGKSGVLLPSPDGTPTFKHVRVGPTSGTNTVITRGLKEGDLVFLGLDKDQLQKQGYNSESSGGGGGRGGGGFGGGRGGGGGVGTSAPIPRSLSR
jgi:HlyD family secretion protein